MVIKIVIALVILFLPLTAQSPRFDIGIVFPDLNVAAVRQSDGSYLLAKSAAQKTIQLYRNGLLQQSPLDFILDTNNPNHIIPSTDWNIEDTIITNLFPTIISLSPGGTNLSLDMILIRDIAPGVPGQLCSAVAGDFAFVTGKLYACLPNEQGDRIWMSFTPDVIVIPPPPPIVKYRLTLFVSPPDSGTVTVVPALEQRVNLEWGGSVAGQAGGQVTLTAVPASGYKFLTWYLGGTWSALISNPLSITVDKARTVSAYFVKF